MRLEENLYTFMLPPFGGYVKKIKDFELESTEKGVYLVNTADKNKSFELSYVKKPYLSNGGNKYMFVLKALFIPIIFSLVILVLGSKMLLYFNVVALSVGGVILLVVGLDLISTLPRLRSYESGLSVFTKHDKIKVLTIIFSFFFLTVTSQYFSYFGYIELSSFFMLVTSYIIYLEFIKKQMFVLLSKNVFFWRYTIIGDNKNINFFMLSPSFKIETAKDNDEK